VNIETLQNSIATKRGTYQCLSLQAVALKLGLTYSRKVMLWLLNSIQSLKTKANWNPTISFLIVNSFSSSTWGSIWFKT